MPMILGRASASQTERLNLDTTAAWNVSGFIELSVLPVWFVHEPAPLELSTWISWSVAGVPELPIGPVYFSATSGGLDVESMSLSASRDQGIQMDVTVIGDARARAVRPVTVQIGDYSAVYSASGTLSEYEFERTSATETTTLHATDRSLIDEVRLAEIVPWERDAQVSAADEQREERLIARTPAGLRSAARRDPRTVPVDSVVLAALASTPHRLLVPTPFPGYRLKAEGPSYSTSGRTARQVVQDLWGTIGIQAGFEDGMLVIRGPGPVGDLVLNSPVESLRIERITLDAPVIEIEGGLPADPELGQDAADSSDPDERENGVDDTQFERTQAPTPSLGKVAARAVPLTWEPVRGASQYIVERLEGEFNPFALWSRAAITTATRWVDDTVHPVGRYHYRLQVNATATAGTSQNTIYLPSEPVSVITPSDAIGVPGVPARLDSFRRTSTGFSMSWDEPEVDPVEQPAPRHDAAERYELRIYLPDNSLARLVETTQTNVTVDGLPVGALLRIELRGVNSAGPGDKATASVQLVNLPPLAPDGFEVVEAPGDHNKLAVVRIKHDPDDGATGYVVQRRLADDPNAFGPWIEQLTFSVPDAPVWGKDAVTRDLEQQIELPEFETRYQFRAKAVNAAGSSPWSELDDVTTDAPPPEPEADPEVDAIESDPDGTYVVEQEDRRGKTTSWTYKKSGRLVGTRSEVRAWVPANAKLALTGEAGPGDAKALRLSELSRTTVYYEIPGWPLTETGRVTETLKYSPADGTTVTGNEQQTVFSRYSPQGHMKQRITHISRPSAVRRARVGTSDVDNPVYLTETKTETWTPVGNGLWRYEMRQTGQAYVPEYVKRNPARPGYWSDSPRLAEITIASESSTSEQSPPMATQPQQTATKSSKKEFPPLVENESSPALERREFGERWFSDAVPGTPPVPKDDPNSPDNGNSDTSGAPAPSQPEPTDTRDPIRDTYTQPGAETGANPVTIASSIPWVTTSSGLRRYAEYAARAGGARYRITRRYILPVAAPSLDRVESVQVSLEFDQFAMTVVTESRTSPE